MLRLLAGRRHLGRQDAGRAVERREGLVEHRHVPADRRVLLDEVDLLARLRQLERRLDAGDAAAHDHHVRIHRDLDRLERRVEGQAVDLGAQDALGLLGGLARVLRHPRGVLADVGHLQQVGVEPGIGGRLAEGRLVHRGRAGRDDGPRDAVLLDVLLDQVLAGVRAHVLVLARDGDVGLFGRPARDLCDVDLAGDVGAAVADVDADLLFWHRPLLLAAQAGTAASTGAQETTCLSMASCFGSAPSARPASWVKYMTGMSKSVP